MGGEKHAALVKSYTRYDIVRPDIATGAITSLSAPANVIKIITIVSITRVLRVRRNSNLIDTHTHAERSAISYCTEDADFDGRGLLRYDTPFVYDSRIQKKKKAM